MTLEHTRAQATSQPVAAPTGTPCVTEQLLPICCVCGLIRDDIRKLSHRERWMTAQIYRKTYHVNPTTCLLTHTYCQKCFTSAQNAARTYTRKIEA